MRESHPIWLALGGALATVGGGGVAGFEVVQAQHGSPLHLWANVWFIAGIVGLGMGLFILIGLLADYYRRKGSFGRVFRFARAKKLRIVEAVYFTGERSNDVTSELRALMAADGRLEVVVDNVAMGGDPHEGVEKQLRVVYRLGRQTHEAVVAEGTVLSLP